MAKLAKKFNKLKNKTWDSLLALSVAFLPNIKRQTLVLPASGLRNPRLVLFAHYSPDNRVHPYVLRYIESLRAADCDVILVSTSDDLVSEDVKALTEQQVSVIVRRNVGYDFGSWRTALGLVPRTVWASYDSLVFVNDSVYGPLVSLQSMFDQVDKAQWDVWGATTSEERAPHIQTYFWGVGKRAIASGFVDYFWFDYYRFYSRRQRVIDRYELKLMALAKEKFGLNVGAVWESGSVRTGLKTPSDRPKRFNPVRHAWRELIEHNDFPFLKREIFKTPENYSLVESVVSERNSNVWALIKDHLEIQARFSDSVALRSTREGDNGVK